MKKKVSALLLAAVMLLSLAACGGGDKPGKLVDGEQHLLHYGNRLDIAA